MAQSRSSGAAPVEEAGQHVAVEVNEPEGCGVALADVVNDVNVECPLVRASSTCRVYKHKSFPRADSPNALTSITLSSLSTSAGACPPRVSVASRP